MYKALITLFFAPDYQRREIKWIHLQIFLLIFYRRKFFLNTAHLLNGAVSWTDALTFKKKTAQTSG